MAFEFNKLHQVAHVPCSFQNWQYVTTSNAKATVDNANYFVNPALAVGDHIVANCSDGTIALRVTAMSDAGAATTAVLWQSAA